MKQHFLRFTIFVFIAGTVFAQNAENPIPQMDEAVKTLAQSIHNKVTAENAQKIAVANFPIREPPAFWALTGAINFPASYPTFPAGHTCSSPAD